MLRFFPDASLDPSWLTRVPSQDPHSFLRQTQTIPQRSRVPPSIAESPKESPITPGSLVVPRHGRGAIRHGSLPGGPGGSGRPKSAIREALADIVEEHGVPFVRDVLSGDTPASVYERATVFDKAAKYGIGTTKELTVEQVRDRLSQQIRTITDELPRLISAMGEGASTTVRKSVLPL